MRRERWGREDVGRRDEEEKRWGRKEEERREKESRKKGGGKVRVGKMRGNSSTRLRQ